MEPVDDQALIVQCRAGDQGAFKELVQRYRQKVYGIALGMVHNPDDAMDVTQEAFIRVHRYLDHFKGTASFYTWLYRITINLSIDQLRRIGKARSVDYDDTIAHDAGTDGNELLPVLPDANPEKNLDRKELSVMIHRALGTLSPAHKAVILMREVEGLSYQEMAKAMECSIGTIMSRLFHARRRMQAALAEILKKEAAPCSSG